MTANARPEVGSNKRDYVLAELRCAVVKAKLAQLDLEATALALQYNIVTAEQAVALFWDSEAVAFLGLELGGAS